MSRRRAQSAPAVSLFPFLAVLVCAMGSLILLLLVISRHVRPQVVTSPLVAETEQIVEISKPTTPILISEFVAEPQTPAEPVFVPEPEVPFFSPEQIVANAPDAIPFVAKRDASLAQQLAMQQLKTERERQQFLLQELQKQLSEAESKKDQYLRQLPLQQTEQQQLQKRLTQLKQQQSEQQANVQKASADLSQLQLKLANMQSEQSQLQQNTQDRKNKWQVVAYDGTSGVQKEPIFLECRLGEVVLHPENVAISIQDLETLPPETSPLIFAIRAIQKYRSQQGRPAEPYVLMVGRPEGISEFYTCGQILTLHRIPFGYELIGKSQELYFGPSDPEARRMAQDAVDQSLLQSPIPRGRFARLHSPAQGSGSEVTGTPRGTMNPAPANTGGRLSPSSTEQFPQQPTGSQNNQPAGIPEQGIGIDQFLANQRQQQRQQMIPQEVAPLTKTPPSRAAAEGFPSRPPQLSASGQSSGRSHNSAISLERSIDIKLYTDGCQIGRRDFQTFPPFPDAEQYQLWLLQQLEAEVQSWEAPPEGITWKPVLQLQVGPGGNTAALRLEELASRMDVRVESSVLFEKPSDLTPDLFPDR